jgi:hypothetical protein
MSLECSPRAEPSRPRFEHPRSIASAWGGWETADVAAHHRPAPSNSMSHPIIFTAQRFRRMALYRVGPRAKRDPPLACGTPPGRLWVVAGRWGGDAKRKTVPKFTLSGVLLERPGSMGGTSSSPSPSRQTPVLSSVRWCIAAAADLRAEAKQRAERADRGLLDASRKVPRRSFDLRAADRP